MFVFGKVLDQLIRATLFKIKSIIDSSGDSPGLTSLFALPGETVFLIIS